MEETQKYSTTRKLRREKPIFECSAEDGKIQSSLFLPEVNGRMDEGGLRTQGYFKGSFPEHPLITVVTVVFNGEEFLEDTIKSIIEQTYDNVEYIIVDGGSTDGTLDIIRKYEHAIDYWVSEPDKGIYDAMNKGVVLASGDWLNFMNSGDFFSTETTLSTVVANFYGLDDVYFGRARVVAGDKVWLYPSVSKEKISIWSRKEVPNHQAMFFPKKFYSSNLYDLTYEIASDADYKYRAKKCARFIFIDSIICNFSWGGVSSYISCFASAKALAHERGKCSLEHVGHLHALKAVFAIYSKFFLSRISGSILIRLVEFYRR